VIHYELLTLAAARDGTASCLGRRSSRTKADIDSALFLPNSFFGKKLIWYGLKRLKVYKLTYAINCI
jgi:hypothetical protein